MPTWKMRVACLALGLACLPAGVAGAGPGQPRSAESVLAEGPPGLGSRLEQERLVVLEDVGEGSPDSFVVAYVLFSRERSQVLSLLRQAARQTEYRPELAEVRTVTSLPDGRVDEQQMKIAFKTLTYRLRYREDSETGRISWGLDPDFDNDIARLDGFWDLYEFESRPDRTLGRFGSNADVGRGVPRFVQRGMSRKTVLRYVRNCREWIDSNGEWRP